MSQMTAFSICLNRVCTRSGAIPTSMIAISADRFNSDSKTFLWISSLNDSSCEPSIAYSNSVSKLEIKTFEIVNIFGHSFWKRCHIMQFNFRVSINKTCSCRPSGPTRQICYHAICTAQCVHWWICSLSSVYKVYLLDETIHTRQGSTIMHYPKWQCTLNKQSHVWMGLLLTLCVLWNTANKGVCTELPWHYFQCNNNIRNNHYEAAVMNK